MAAAFVAKALVLNGAAEGEQGVLGGPIALAAPQVNVEQALLDAGSQASEELPSVELSTGSLDGASALAARTEEGRSVGAGAASLEEENEEVLAEAKKAAQGSASTAAASRPAAKAPAASSAPVSPSRYFIQPASGRNWGVRHGQNAVDIANSCGTPVKAAAAGVVVPDSRLGSGNGGYNSGYGSFVILKHPNGTKTRYAHLSKIYVAVGQSVVQGEQIGTIGNTGNVRGATGCHLHFEVLGAANPFARS